MRALDPLLDFCWHIFMFFFLPSSSVLYRQMFSLPTLPYPLEEGIPPTISAKQLDLHYNKHHNTYVTKLNGFVSADDSLKGKSLEEIVSLSAADPSKKGIFNNAAQHFNHSFYWSCLKPNGSKIPAELEVCTGICP